MNDDERGPLEQAYDNDILPLMREVRRLCMSYGIRMVAGFDLDANGDTGEPLLATHNTILTRADLDKSSTRLCTAVVALKDLDAPEVTSMIMITGPRS